MREMLPPDPDTKLLVTCNPLMLAMVVAVFELRRGATAMPRTTAELYQTAADAMLARSDVALVELRSLHLKKRFY